MRKSRKIIIPETVIKMGAEYDILGPRGMEIANARTFSGCAKLKILNIPFGVTEIGSYSFNDCGELAEITIPSSVNRIGAHAFNGCAKLTKVYFEDLHSFWLIEPLFAWIWLPSGDIFRASCPEKNAERLKMPGMQAVNGEWRKTKEPVWLE